MKKLLTIAYIKREEDEAKQFIDKVKTLIKEGLEQYVKYYIAVNNRTSS